MNPRLASWIANKNNGDSPLGKGHDGPGAAKNDRQDPKKKKKHHRNQVLQDRLKNLQGAKK